MFPILGGNIKRISNHYHYIYFSIVSWGKYGGLCHAKVKVNTIKTKGNKFLSRQMGEYRRATISHREG